MTDAPDFDLDAALSAELDGDLDAYAADLGVTRADVEDRLAGPAADARRSALTRARDELAAGVPPLDAVTRRRLLHAATPNPEPRPARGRRRLATLVAAAAAVALVVVGVVALTGGTDDTSGGGSAKSATGTAAPPRGDLGDLGSLDQAGIGALLRGRTPTPTGAAGGPAEKSLTPSSTPASDTAGAATVASPEQVTACAQQYASDGTPRFQGAASYLGQPAVVLGVDTGDRTIVFVVAADNCLQVLYSASR